MNFLKKLIRFAKTADKELRVQRLDTALLSEKALASDWLSKKEDDLWKDL
ncbi:MAG: DUF2281 domain-containing protein [Candidatus Diapherotrites archaeon]|nr:DUF2281 domain-containing protein [Candidatus Diapherotrites archaeon]